MKTLSQGDGASAVLICNELGCLEAFQKTTCLLSMFNMFERTKKISNITDWWLQRVPRVLFFRNLVVLKAWIAEARSQAIGEERVGSEL